MTNAQARVAQAVLFLMQYDGDFGYLVDMKRKTADGTYQMTDKQVNAVLRCKAVEEKRRGGREKMHEVELGVYKVSRNGGEGDFNFDVYKVQQTRDKQRRYAKKLVPINGWRMNDEGDRVQWSWEYARGALALLQPEHRMSEEDARQFGLQYRICAACGRGLKQADSVERGIGPVCIKWFRF